jgi:anti-anti-sigma factor
MVFESDVLGVEEADKIKDELMSFFQTQDKALELDLGNVNKVDLCALQLLLSLKKSLEDEERTLLLLNCTNSVVEAFELCGCFQLLECRHE